MKSLRQALFLVFVGTVLALTVNLQRNDGIPWRGDGSSASAARIVMSDVEAISAEDARSLDLEGRLVFLDPRDTLLFRENHLIGSMNLYPGDILSNLAEIEALADAGMELVILCDGKDCPLGVELAKRLRKNNFSSFKMFWGGLPAWQKEISAF